MKKNSLAIVLIAILFAGCTSKTVLPYEENFSCEKGANGGICERTSTIYQIDDKPKQQIQQDTNISIVIDTSNTKIAYQNVPNRTREKFAKTYLYPYKDKDGDLHSSKVIYIKYKDGDWEDVNLFDTTGNEIRGINEYNK